MSKIPMPQSMQAKPDIPTAPSYAIEMSFDRLVPGVDNLRVDVFLSPELRRVTRNVARLSAAKYAQAEEILNIKNPRSAVKERDEFKRICGEVLQGGVHSAKLHEEIQVDLLGQVATFKMIIESVREQYDEITKGYQRRILAGEQAGQRDIKETLRLKERLSIIRENRSAIIRQTGLDVFQCLFEVHRDFLVPLRTASFGVGVVLPDEIFLNPLLHIMHPPEDDIMLEMYILLGRRLEDPDRYDALLSLLRELIGNTLNLDGNVVSTATGASEDFQVSVQEIDQVLTQADSVERLFNAPLSQNALKRLQQESGPAEDKERLNKLANNQARRLQFLYRRFRREGLMKRICAAYEIKSICPDYCPPLQPMQILQFLTVRKSRRLIAGRLKVYRKAYGKNLPLGPLRQKAWSLWRISRSQQKIVLIQFLKDFLRYHRDLGNYRLLSDAMDRIGLTEEKKSLDLSRANKTLHEFLLPHERAPEEKPISRHVILKADVRGATELTHRMIERRLNPASFFSLNFFEPISNILPGYGAEKVFIEGDAVILSIMEREAEPSNWYAVSRACGLAVQILMIIARYNDRSEQNNLPVLEVGCGISYLDSPPAFLFDGDSRIMISPAINHADRMSGCTRALRGQKGMRSGPFNLRVLQTTSSKEHTEALDDLCIRYNVNGIELNAAGFKKLSKEIKLKTVEYVLPGPKQVKALLFTGKFPTVTGQYQRLIVREARIPEVMPDSLSFLKWTGRKYYEVCTQPDLYEFVRSGISA
jgi:hypothetical protein